MGRVFFVVGHEQWGKSRTLTALVGSGAHSVEIGGVRFFVRRMSNDDYPDKFAEFVEELDPAFRRHAIVALCPKFDDPGHSVAPLLDGLRGRYDLLFFVLRHEYQGDRSITATEVARLGQFGTVEVFEPRAEAAERAAALRRFVTSHTS